MPEFSPGLEGVVAARRPSAKVDGANGRLIYRGGYLIEDLFPVVSFEEAAFLLWNGELPDKDTARRPVPADVGCTAAQGERPRRPDVDGPADRPDGHPAHRRFSPGRDQDADQADIGEAIALTAVFPTIVAAAYRRREGKEIVEPRSDLAHAANLSG